MEPALHIAIPTLVAIAVGVPIEIAIPLIPLSLVYDLDILFEHHRRLHSVIILIGVAIPVWYLWISKVPHLKIWYTTGLFYVATHLLLDLFSGEIGIFYPLSPKGYGLRIDVMIDNTPIRIGAINFSVKIIPEIERKKGSYTLLSGEGVIAILLLVSAVVGRYLDIV